MTASMVYLWEYWLEYFSLQDNELPSNVSFGGRNPDELASQFLHFGTHFYQYWFILLLKPFLLMFLMREFVYLRREHFNFLFFL